jgi:hypothetical protein
MPIDLEFHNDEIVVVTAGGVVTYDEVVDSLRAVWKDDRFDFESGKLLDLRQLETSGLGLEEFRKILSEGLPLKQMARRGRIAVVPPTDFSTAMLRMYQQLAGRLPIRIGICRDLEHAHDWLGAGDNY